MNMDVIDTFGVVGDREMTSLVLALDPAEVERQINHRLRIVLAGKEGSLCLREIRVTRYKPGRRCLIEYDVEVERPGAPPEVVVLIGKVRAKRYGKSGYRLLESFWNGGFKSDNPDGIFVPEPIGTIPEFRMWLQRKVRGESATSLLAAPEGVELCRRVAEAIHKVHRANVPDDRAHTMSDELRILHERLPQVAQARQEWSRRIERLLVECDRLGARVPEPRARGIHRDFYPAQVIVHKGRLCLLDFDLYCNGDPALDVGNFIGHITEQSLRIAGNPAALVGCEQALENRFVELAGEPTRAAVQAYATLTLVRHVYISTLFPDRQQFTERLLEMCEQRLGEDSES
jgi:hypothetical protein